MSNPNATYDSTATYPRDLVGYGRQVPHAQWPNQARIAVQFVLNYEEGGENATVHLSLIHISEPTRSRG